MSENQSSYRQIMKATSIFGGVQVFQILIQIIRSKFVAVLLGPTGMGIVGLLTSTLSLISSLTNFGLSSSAVKNIAEANGTGNIHQISVVSKVLKKLVWITGLLGSVITIVLSPWLSQLTFGNKEYTLAFVWLSVTLLLNQLSNGQMVILQGMRKLEYLAKANLWGSTLGLIVTVPIYYCWGVRGIVPVMFITACISFYLSWLYSHKVQLQKVKVSRLRTMVESKNMMTMGFMLSLSGLISTASAYIVRIFISYIGGVEDVGLYSAGFNIIGTYVGMVFAAMGTDYYPRLAEVSKNNLLSKNAINQQAEIALLILGPILIGFLVFINWVIILLYSSNFLAINAMIYWASLGMFFKAVSWSIGFVFLAKSESKLFFFSELAGNLYMLVLNIGGYYFWGLTGLGVSFLIGYIFVFFQVYIIARYKYNFSFDNSFVKIFVILFGLSIVTFISVLFLDKMFSYIGGVIFIFISGYFSCIELDKRLDLKSIILKKNKIK